MKNKLDFKKGNGLIPVIIQDNYSKEVLMLGYMNELAYYQTIKTGTVYFWSRSRDELWLKGKRSGNTLKVIELKPDCDNDTILILVKYTGKTICHLGKATCF